MFIGSLKFSEQNEKSMILSRFFENSERMSRTAHYITAKVIYICENSVKKQKLQLTHSFTMQPEVCSKQSGEDQSSIPHHTYHEFGSDHNKQQKIYFSSCFDSGNLNRVKQHSTMHYSIWTAVDAQGTINQGYPKSWFHFEVGGGVRNKKLTFSVHRVHFLWAMFKKNQLYRPVFKVYREEGESEWSRLPHPIISLSMNEQDQLVLKFDFYFTHDIKRVRFAFLYPYSHEDVTRDVKLLQSQYQNDSDIFFQSCELTKSYQKRNIDIVIISSHQGKKGYEQIKTDEYFCPKQKLTRFRESKPIIFISARVHPIETPASFCMKGVMEYLLRKDDYRAHLLRKYFVFVLVPMLNPDGVSNGHCRMDHLNQNLNRYYKNPDPIKQPSCYAVRKLCEHFQKDKRMFMYLDLHAHPAHKGNFMFGNAIYDFVEQVQSQLFPHILSQNCINFEFENCIFSRRHMKAKDRNEDMNKEGCGRVVFYKDFGIPHAYTLECGYHLNAFNNNISPASETEKKFISRYKLNKEGNKVFEANDRELTEDIIESQGITFDFENKEQQSNEDLSNRQGEQEQDEHDLDTKNSSVQNQTCIEDQKQGNSEEVNTKPVKIDGSKKEVKENNSDMEQLFCSKSKRTIHSRKSNKLNSQKLTKANSKRAEHINDCNKVKKQQKYDGYKIFGFTCGPMDDIQDKYYKRTIPMYETRAYENLGRNMMISILDIFNKNPYSRNIDLNEKRKMIASKQAKLDRFRKEQARINTKMKNIVELIEDQFYLPWYKRNIFTYGEEVTKRKIRSSKRTDIETIKYSQLGNNQSVKVNRTKQNNQVQLTIEEASGRNALNRGTLEQMERMKNQSVTQDEDIEIEQQQDGVEEETIKPVATSLNKAYQKSKLINERKTLSTKLRIDKSSSKKGSIRDIVSVENELDFKRQFQIPKSQNNIMLQEELTMFRNEGLCLSTKLIKNPIFNVGNLRIRNFVMQGKAKGLPHQLPKYVEKRQISTKVTKDKHSANR